MHCSREKNKVLDFACPPLGKINNRVFQLENGTLEYHHLSPSSANVTEENNYFKYS